MAENENEIEETEAPATEPAAEAPEAAEPAEAPVEPETPVAAEESAAEVEAEVAAAEVPAPEQTKKSKKRATPSTAVTMTPLPENPLPTAFVRPAVRV